MTLLDDARDRAADLIECIGDLVRVESPSSDVEACRKAVWTAGALARGWTGIAPEVFEHGGRPVLRWGAAQPRVLLLGHLDTVWPIGTLERIPWQVDGDRLRGPGVFDMKTGVIQAFAATALLGSPDGLGILLTTDEEIGSGTSRDLIEQAAAAAEAVLVLEPSIDGDLKSARKGTSWYVVEVRGRAAHAGLDPEKGVNALVEAVPLVEECITWARPDIGTTVTPTTARAGTTDNTVPDRAVIGIDVRAWSAEEQVRVDTRVRGWQPGHPEATTTIIDGGINRPAMEESTGKRLTELAISCAHDLGLPTLSHRAVGGASDGNFTAALGVPTLDGLGAVGDGAHADHEWASASAVPERTALLATIIQRVLDGGLT